VYGARRRDTGAQERALGARPDREWWGGRPLSEARNAHRTNTREQFEDALQSGANWFEGDIRKEINSDRLEMRHDVAHESGDNLTLEEWLTMGRDSGRGLKLDVKEPGHVPEILDTVERVGVPHERLMFNLGYGAFERWGKEIRERFPDALLALNPPGEGAVDRQDAEALVEQARRLGGPVTFVVRHDLLTDEAIRTLQGHGTISVWGGGVDDLKAATEALRARGVNGMIDLSTEGGPSLGDRVDAAKNWVKTGLDKIF
jgi:hypothetical protein